MDGVEDENEERRPRRTFSGHLVVVLLSGSFRFQDQTTCSLPDVIKLRQVHLDQEIGRLGD
jgi:hypothetical protein